MATQTRLPTKFSLDKRSRDAGRRGLAKARAALAETTARVAEQRRAEVGDDHATAA